MNNQLLELPKQTSILLLVLLTVNLLPLASTLATWFVAICIIVILWQWAIFYRLVALPKTWMKSLVALSGCILLIVTGKSLGLLAGMIHLLCLAYILKPLEINKRSDFYQFVILSFLVSSTAFIFHQSIYFSFIVYSILLLDVMLLLSFFYRSSKISAVAKYAGKLLLQSLPIAIALFLLFPKIAPFWQVPQAKSTQTGLSDSLTIGDISKLVLSNDLAFRVEFAGKPPSYKDLYWRALVLERFDGKTWQRKYSDVDQVKTFAQVRSNRHNLDLAAPQLVRYEITQEASYQPWLFVLDLGQPDSANLQRDIFVLDDYSLYLKGGVNNPVAYKLISDLDAKLDLYESERDLRFNTKLPTVTNPRLFELGQTLATQYTEKRDIVDQVLLQFRQNNYRYTLEPPVIPDNSLDTFFFETQAGFCEHYASSFTYLMRAAGIPARVVLGYMGGSYNSQGRYFRILQREAHAWSEVWIEGEGWIRIDPTAAVDPTRVSQGFSSQLLQQQQQLASFNIRRWISGEVFEKFRYYVDMLDYQWTKAVINYSSQQQFNLLRNWFGQQFKVAAIATILATLVGVVLLYFAVRWLSAATKARSNRLLYSYERMLILLAKKGIVKSNAETDSEFIARINEIDSTLAIQVAIVLRCYNRQTYQQSTANKQDNKTIVLALKTIRQLTK